LAPPAVVTVAAGETVYVSGQKALGSTSAAGAGGLGLRICYRPVGSTAVPTIQFTGPDGLRVAQNQRIQMGLSSFISGLAAGNWQVGLCGYSSDFANWNNNEYGNNTALVYRSANGAGPAGQAPAK
jgi:hypothetical protein